MVCGWLPRVFELSFAAAAAPKAREEAAIDEIDEIDRGDGQGCPAQPRLPGNGRILFKPAKL